MVERFIHRPIRSAFIWAHAVSASEVFKSSPRLYEALKHKVCGTERLKHPGYSGGEHVKTNRKRAAEKR